MNMWWQRRSVRVRLTLWYVAAMVVVLAVYATTVLAIVSRNVSNALDDRLHGDFQWAAEMAEQKSDGTVAWFEGAHSTDEDTPWLQVWTSSGKLMYRSRRAEVQPLPDSHDIAFQLHEPLEIKSVGVLPFRMLSGKTTLAGQPVIIQVARSELPSRNDVIDLTLIFVFGLPLGVAAAGLGGYALASRALARALPRRQTA